VTLDPEDQAALYNLFRALAQNSPEEAQEYKARLLALRKESEAKSLNDAATISASKQNWNKAISQMKEALELCADCGIIGDLHKNLGLIYAHAGDLKNAEEQLRVGQRFKPDDGDVQKALQMIEAQKNQ
jgi:tetratricopeptide (TPR) repeat protein